MGIVFFNNQTFGLISPTGVIFAAVRQNVPTFYLAQSCSVTKTLQQKVSRISHGPHADTWITWIASTHASHSSFQSVPKSQRHSFGCENCLHIRFTKLLAFPTCRGYSQGQWSPCVHAHTQKWTQNSWTHRCRARNYVLAGWSFGNSLFHEWLMCNCSLTLHCWFNNFHSSWLVLLIHL